MKDTTIATEDSSYFGFTLSLLLIGFVGFIAAANGSRTLASFSAIVMALMIAVRLWARISIARLDVKLESSAERMYFGEAFTLKAEIANRKILPVWMRLELPHSDALSLADGDALKNDSLTSETDLLPFERRNGSWIFTATRRGVHHIGPTSVVAGDLLDLYRRKNKLSFERDIVVFPRIVPIGDFDLPFRDYFGIHPAKGIIEDPAWYEGTREYSGNKPAKNIHWKASARLNVLQEKIFEPTSHQKVFFLLDGGGFARAEDKAGFEAALEILASLAVRFAETGASIAVATDRKVRNMSAALPLGRGPEHLGMLLELLARCEFEGGRSIASLIGSVGTEGAGFIVVSKSPDENTSRFFALPSTRRNRMLFVFAEKPQPQADSAAILPSYPATWFDELRTAKSDEIGVAMESDR
jgi:uncharacterized protein (DUF58 family)